MDALICSKSVYPLILEVASILSLSLRNTLIFPASMCSCPLKRPHYTFHQRRLLHSMFLSDLADEPGTSEQLFSATGRSIVRTT